MERSPNSLGMSETFGPHSMEFFEDGPLPEECSGSFGRAVGTVDRKIVDPETGRDVPIGEWGELCVRNHGAMMLGFHRKERHDCFDRDNYYHTGDKCMLNKDGYLFFAGRLTEMIKISGANISPREVELVMMAEPDVAEAAVLALPDEGGEMLVAAVVPRRGRSIEEEELRSRLRKQLASYKVPKRFFVLQSQDIPRTVSSKVQKPELAKLLRERLASGEWRQQPIATDEELATRRGKRQRRG
jgi:acyl-CoA synthetase (AMP-forming)/AMP-acid ligase II